MENNCNILSEYQTKQVDHQSEEVIDNNINKEYSENRILEVDLEEDNTKSVISQEEKNKNNEFTLNKQLNSNNSFDENRHSKYISSKNNEDFKLYNNQTNLSSNIPHSNQTTEFSDYKDILNDLKKNGIIKDKIIVDELEKNIQKYIDNKFNKLEDLIQNSNAQLSKKIEDENLKLSNIHLSQINHKEPENIKTNKFNSLNSTNNCNSKLKDASIYESIILDLPKEECKESSFDKMKTNEVVHLDNQISINNNDRLNNSIIKIDHEEDYYVSISKQRNKSQITSSIVFIDDICGICSSEIKRAKYSCLVCENLSICEYCERSHNHPLLKFKDINICSVEEAAVFLEKNKSARMYAKKYFDVGMFDNRYKVKLKTISTVFSMRPDSKCQLFVNITNDCKYVIPGETLILAKNNKDLLVESYLIRDEIKPREIIEVAVNIRSGENTKLHDFEIIVFNKKVLIDHDTLRLKIDVNLDYEEDDFNLKLYKYPKLITVQKEAKLKILKILNEELSDKHPYILYTALQRTGFNLEKCLNYLYSVDTVNP